MSMAIRTRSAVVLVVLALTGCTDSEPTPAPQSGPVITRIDDPRLPYPAALISGRLTQRDGCLMINDSVAFWPPGTTWDPEADEVVFGHEFSPAPAARLDAQFTGGGGIFVDVASAILDKDAEAAMRGCLARTGATSSVLVYP